MKAGLTWKQVTFRIPPSFPAMIEPPDFISEGGDGLIAAEPTDPVARAKQREEERKKSEEKMKKAEEERKRKAQEELEKRTHRVTLAIHIFENGSGNLPLGSKFSEAPPVLQLLDRFSTAVQAEGWNGARAFLSPTTRAQGEQKMKENPSDAEAFRAHARPVAALFAVELNGRLFVCARLPDATAIFGHIQFSVSKFGDEYLLGFPEEISEDEAVLLHDLGTAFLKNGKSVAPLEVK